MANFPIPPLELNWEAEDTTSGDVASNELRPSTDEHSGSYLRVDQWVVIRGSSNSIKEQIALVSDALDDLLKHICSSNLPDEEKAVSGDERQDLIDLLETALATLKGPMTEVGMLTWLKDVAKEAAAKAVKKQTEKAM